METQAISAPADGLTTEKSKRRRVGYGLPCAKCHKYFPADLEVCPICKGRERVSPVVAPRIPKPVKSETSVAPSSSNTALQQEVKELPKSESPAFAPLVEINVKEQPLDHKESITIPVVAELQAAVEPARASLELTQPALTHPVLTEEEKESPKTESPAFAPPEEVHAVEVHAEDQPLIQKESITVPSLTAVQETIEPVPNNAMAAKDVRFTAEAESPTVAASVAGSIECPCLDPLEELIVIPALAEAEPRIASVAESMTSVQPEQLPEELEAPAFSVDEKASVEDPCLNDQANNDQPNSDQPNQEEPIAIPALVEAQACDPVATAMATVREEEKLTTESEAPAAAVTIHAAVDDQRQDDQRKEDQRLDAINEALRIVIPMLLEVQASEPVPTAAAPEYKVGELLNELESPAVEEQHPDPTCHEEPIVIPTLVETQASEPAPVATEREMLEQETKEEVPEMSETPMPASEVNVAEVEIAEIKIAEVKTAEVKTVEIKTVESPGVFNPVNHRPGKEKSKAIDKGSDAPPKPADVSVPVVLHVNLGELSAPKGTPERAPAAAQFPAQSKEIESPESKASRADTSSDAYAPVSAAPVSGRKFDLVTFVLGVVVLACAVLLITLVTLRLMPHHASESVRKAKAAYSTVPPTADQNTDASIPTPPPAAAAPANSASSDSSAVVAPSPVPAQPPATSASSLSSSPASERVLALSPSLAEGNLLYRVEPDYPEEARRQGVQGPVALDLHISKDGLVQGVNLVSGQPILADAAISAAKQWRFKPHYVDGSPVEMQTRITLHFNLPTHGE